jgi:hypothetical protein
VYRNRLALGIGTIAALYIGASTATGALCGFALGSLGAALTLDARAALASAAALVGLAAGVAATLGVRVRPLQWDRETSQRWVRAGPIAWPLLNGAALGFGATSRIGFVLWYAIPIAAVCAGTPAGGALIYGSYGFVRAASVGLLILAGRRRSDGVGVHEWLIPWRPRAERLVGAYTLGLSALTITAFGI